MTGEIDPIDELEDIVRKGREQDFFLSPRQYQIQLFERAKKENIIACMGTGSGKTLVSVMLLKYMFNKEVSSLQSDSSSTAKKRLSFFLVNKIPLVRQQAQVIMNNSCLKVIEIFGDFDQGIEMSKLASRWNKILREGQYDVIIATAQMVLDALKHAFLHIEEMNLIVFDEVHHATKMDAYSRIMQEHYWETPIESRPKIFGMTASPLKSDGDYQIAIVNLQKMMNAKVFTASLELRKELETVCKPPTEHIIQYAPAELMRKGALTARIEEKCGDLEGVQKLLDRMAFVDMEHGPLVSDLTWIGSSNEIKGRMIRKLLQADMEAPETRLLSTDWIQHTAMEKVREKATTGEGIKRIKYVKDAIACSAISEVVLAHDPVPDTLIVDKSNTAPKILALIDLLKLLGSDTILQRNFCCIIFVQRQKTAIALTELLKRVPELRDWLRPEWILGHNTDQGDGMDPKAQADTIRRFGKAGSTNVLIATNVAEEGLDISPCNCVIRFDLFDHHTGYLQSKGRARSSYSRFIVLVERGNSRHLNILSKIATTDQEILDSLKLLPRDQGAISSMDLDEEEADDMDEYSYQLTINSKTTTACIRPIDCVSLVCYYVDRLRRDEFSPQKPDFLLVEDDSLGYQLQIRFPANAKIRIVLGPYCTTKKKARRMACFEACKQLYELGELDENLLPRKIKKVKQIQEPLYTKRRKEKGAAGNVNVVKRKLPLVYSEGIPRAENVEGFLVLNAVIVAFDEQHTGRPVLLLFPSPVAALPEVQLFLDDPRIIPATNDSVHIHLEEADARAACLYSYRMLSLIGRQQFVGDRMPYLILPTTTTLFSEVIDASIIDWAEVHRSAGPLSVKIDEATDFDDLVGTMNDCLVHARTDVLTERFYEVLSIRKDDDTHPNPTVVQEERGKETTIGGSGPIFEVRSIPKQQNLLNCQLKTTTKSSSVTRMLRSVSVVACSASFYRSCTLLPSLLFRYDQVFLARELNENLLDNIVEVKSLVEALTIPEARQAFDYQTLEFFGDCYLKLISCCWAFSKCDSHREGDLHLECASKINNNALLKIAIERDIASYACSHTFTMKTWCPPLLKSLRRSDDDDDDEKGSTLKLADKTMADLVEAVLGAGLVSLTALDLSKASHCAKKLGILGTDTSTNLENFQNMFEEVVRPKEEQGSWSERVQLGTLKRLQDMLSYTFRSPHLALEAVTHSSAVEGDLPSYERLEFLGDAVLDFLVVDLFKGKFKGLDEAGYTIIKQNATCNASLSVICVESNLHLNNFLFHSSSAITDSVSAYKMELADAKREAEENLKEGEDRYPYWFNLKPPKILADMVESMLGAIFVDSGFNLHTTKTFFDKFYKSHFETYFRPDTSVVRSAWDFIQLVRSLNCTHWDLRIEDIDDDGKRARCSLVYHDTVVARRVSRGVNAVAVRGSSKVELDEIRRVAEAQGQTAAHLNEVGAIKAIFQQCLPGDFIRDSEKLEQEVEGEEAVEEDFLTRNRFTVLKALCNCKPQQHHHP